LSYFIKGVVQKRHFNGLIETAQHPNFDKKLFMKHLSILVPNGEGNNLSSIVGAYKIFTRANHYWQQLGNVPNFQIQLVGSAQTVNYYDGLFSVKPHTHFNNINQSNLIIIPSLNHHFKDGINENKELINWIAKQYKSGAEIASICTGAFLLAATGLMDGKVCSTHWSAAHNFRQMFPKVNLQTDNLITDEAGICTNGGAYSFLNLMIYLVEKYFDRQTAVFCAKVFQIEMDRNNQSVFTIFTGQKQHSDEMVLQAQLFIEKNIEDKISIEELSSKLNVGRRSFDRRFVKATGNTPIEYAQRVKIEAAKKAFETNRKTITEVMYEVGYTDVKAFREVFRKITGLSPLEYKRKYNKDTV
jgi:transcriptional regulator GlxA family with amidase domain